MRPGLLDREREVAIAAAESAGAAIMALKSTFSVDYKDAAQDDPVTTADHAADAIIVAALRAAFPKDTIVTEESALPVDYARAERCWFVDPLDGTKELVAGNGEFCVMIGLAIEGRAALGVVFVPAREDGYLLVGQVGGSAERLDHARSAPLRVSTHALPSNTRLVVSRSRTPSAVARILERLGSADVRQCGSVGVKIGELAQDRADAYVHLGRGPKLWDLCAPDAILHAAGGRFTDTRGELVRYDVTSIDHPNGIVATNALLHPAVLDALTDL